MQTDAQAQKPYPHAKIFHSPAVDDVYAMQLKPSNVCLKRNELKSLNNEFNVKKL
jgi:hypothetical protein